MHTLTGASTMQPPTGSPTTNGYRPLDDKEREKILYPGRVLLSSECRAMDPDCRD